MDRLGRLVGAGDVDQQPVFLDRQTQRERPGLPGEGRKTVFVQQVGDRGGALALDFRAAADDAALVEGVIAAMRFIARRASAVEFFLDRQRQRMRVEPSASARRMRQVRGAANPAASQPTSVVRLRKSNTLSPDAKRALRAVGSTWLGPAI